MEWDSCIKEIQNYLSNKPLVILGSGASIEYGIPSMLELADEIKKNKEIFKDKKFCEKMDELGLEKAINNSELSEDLKDKIKTIVWESINKKDLEYFNSINSSNTFPIAELLKKLLQPSGNECTVITTNYDRIVEYATDLIKATIVTGFEGSLIKYLEIPSDTTRAKRTKSRESIVNLWKVHGSLDWFEKTNNILNYPLTTKIPNSFSPLIIPPSREKYNVTHFEPYRSVIGEADKAFKSATSYICIGYGFNDEHIQPKLLQEIKKGKPIVVLTYTMTEACKKYILIPDVQKKIILENKNENRTTVYINNKEYIYTGDYWKLSEFLKAW